MTDNKPLKGIIIGLEGPDGAGKDTYAAGFFQYLSNYFNVVANPSLPFELPKDKDVVGQVVDTWPMDPTIDASGIKVKFLNIREGSESCAEFMKDIHNGKITDPEEIGKGYLKVHVEYIEKARELANTYDLVIMNRTLMSFECLQLRTMGLIGLKQYFTPLVENYQQNKLPHVLLLPDKDLIIERARSKAVSVLDKVFTDKIDAAYDAYMNASASGDWKNTLTITGGVMASYYDSYQKLLRILLAQRFPGHDNTARHFQDPGERVPSLAPLA